MESITIYRALESYLKACNLSRDGMIKIDTMTDTNIHPMVTQSARKRILEEFKSLFEEGMREGILESHKKYDDMGFEYLKRNISTWLSDILGLGWQDRRRIFSDRDNFIKHIGRSIAEDSFRAMYFILFSLLANDRQEERLIDVLQRMKPSMDSNYPIEFEGYEQSILRNLDIDGNGFDNICSFLKEQDGEVYEYWVDNIPRELYEFAISNTSLWSDYRNGSLKIFRINPLGMDLNRCDRPGLYWDCLMALITGHRMSMTMKDDKWEITPCNDGNQYSISDKEGKSHKDESFVRFLKAQFGGRRIGSIIKDAERARIFC